MDLVVRNSQFHPVQVCPFEVLAEVSQVATSSHYMIIHSCELLGEQLIVVIIMLFPNCHELRLEARTVAFIKR